MCASVVKSIILATRQRKSLKQRSESKKFKVKKGKRKIIGAYAGKYCSSTWSQEKEIVKS